MMRVWIARLYWITGPRSDNATETLLTAPAETNRPCAREEIADCYHISSPLRNAAQAIVKARLILRSLASAIAVPKPHDQMAMTKTMMMMQKKLQIEHL